MISVVRARICDVVEDLLAVKAVALGDSEQSLRAKGALRVDIQALSFAAAHIYRQLAGHCEGVAKLGFSGSKLSEELCNRAGLDATCCQRLAV